MIISVMAPHCGGNGTTTTALLLALGLGNMKKKVLLTHTDSISNSLYTYLGLQQFEDKTSTPTQMVKLLREGAIQSEAIPDYCKNISENVYAFTNNKSNFSDEDMETLSEYLVEHSDFEYLIYDFNNFESNTAKYILRKSDVIVLNFTQSIMEFEDFNKEKKKYEKMFAGKKLVLVCNKFNSIIGKDKDIPKKLGVKASCNVIHYNAWLPMACNSGQLLTLYKNIKAKNSKVAELNNDINRLASMITKIRIASLKAKQMEKKGNTARVSGGADNAK